MLHIKPRYDAFILELDSAEVVGNLQRLMLANKLDLQNQRSLARKQQLSRHLQELLKPDKESPLNHSALDRHPSDCGRSLAKFLI